MAGGLGSRLRPLTYVLPKPLIPLSEKTIIEEIIDRFSEMVVKISLLPSTIKLNLLNSI